MNNKKEPINFDEFMKMNVIKFNEFFLVLCIFGFINFLVGAASLIFIGFIVKFFSFNLISLLNFDWLMSQKGFLPHFVVFYIGLIIRTLYFNFTEKE